MEARDPQTKKDKSMVKNDGERVKKPRSYLETREPQTKEKEHKEIYDRPYRDDRNMRKKYPH